MLRPGTILGDRYEIIEKIGAGGMADVYKAKDHKLNRYVAVKVLKAEYSSNKNFVSKFRVEAQSAAGLMHPNIVNVYDVGEEDGMYYFVMELVEGITLKNYIELIRLRTLCPDFITFNITGQVAHLQIAPMIFLPLIENAYKHSSIKEDEKVIDIQIKIVDKTISFLIKNKLFSANFK